MGEGSNRSEQATVAIQQSHYEGGATGSRTIPARPINATRRDSALAAAKQHPKSPSATGLERGTRIGTYELIRLLGRGGMGQVFAARDYKLGRRVAIKFVLDADEAYTRRFLIEARATARCNHENIVVIHDVDEHNGLPFMVLEFLEGQTLTRLVGDQTLSTAQAVEVLLPVARALEHAHKLGIVHRDLKPENIFITEAGVVKVLDFGVAKAVDFEELEPIEEPTQPGGAPRLTQAGTMVGTPPYMAPEQVSADAVDGRADIWAIGVILYELLAGRHPLGASPSRARILGSAAHLDTPMPELPQEVANAAPELAKIITRCLAKRADDRYASASELIRVLAPLGVSQHGRQLDEGECPYPGLTAFSEDDADRFFGRDADVRRALARIREQPIVGVVGPSGAGKSSFVRAGLVPALRATGDWRVLTTRPGRDAMAGLVALLHEVAESDDTCSVDALVEQPGLLGSVLREHARKSERSIVVFVDQFEELYTLASAADRRAYVACLCGLADDVASPIRLILSMRSDFVHRAVEVPTFMRELSRGLVFLSPLGERGMRAALTRPAELVGYSVEEVLADRMLRELGDAPAALPLLQFAASTLWDQRDTGAKTLTLASYENTGGVAGALAEHAERVVADLPQAARQDARLLLLRLVTPQRTRAIVELEELVQASRDQRTAREVISHLVRARLLVVDTDTDVPTVELTHESLLTSWPALSRWIEEERESLEFEAQLRDAAKQWHERKRAAGLLWRGDALADATSWKRRHPHRDLAEREQAFLDAAFAHDEHASKVRRRLAIAGTALLLAIATAAVVAMLWINRAEREARSNAESARDQAQQALTAQRNEQAANARELRAKRDAKTQTKKAEVATKGRADAEHQAQSAQAEVKVKDADLKRTNEELRRSLTTQRREAKRARDAQRAAETESTRARKAEKELREKKTQLEQHIRTKDKKLLELRRQLQKISTELK